METAHKDKINESLNELNYIQKIQALSAYKDYRNQLEREKPFHEQCKNLGKITWISDTLQIAEYFYRENKNDKPKTMYMAIVDGQVTNHVAETPEMAVLNGLAYKYDGINSRFAYFAARMLNNFEPEK